MQIADHRLTSTPFVESPNQSGPILPEYLLLHYTAGQSAASSIEWFRNPASKSSAHLVVARDGSITQMVPFHRAAWHAGQSQWQGRRGLNQFSIGIEIDNAGKLHRDGKLWRAWFGAVIPADRVLEAVHKNESEPAGWHTYTPAQLDAVREVSMLLVSHYHLKEILGHDDVSPGRKTDPGPAFPDYRKWIG